MKLKDWIEEMEFKDGLRNELDEMPLAPPYTTNIGVKNDDGKILAALLGDFSRALLGVANVGTFGANKYTRGGWLHVKDNKQRYTDALWRHLLQSTIDDLDAESGLSHLEHAAWNILAVIELIKREKNGNQAAR